MTKGTPAISFVVPVYNMAPFVAECLASIIRQEGNYDYEVIVIDDASTDASADVIESFDDARIRFIRHPENQGAARTITEGLTLARGRYVARIDPDDRYRPYFLDHTVEVLDRNPDVGLVYGRIATIDDAGQITDPGTAYPAAPANAKMDCFFPAAQAKRPSCTDGIGAPASLGTRPADTTAPAF